MVKLSLAEENYIKAIYRLSLQNSLVQTNSIADSLRTKASSVTDMLIKLSAKKLIDYKKYRGVQLTLNGKKQALYIVRKHRLWETFLVTKLGFTWDKIHDIAEQLEHIDSFELVEKLDSFLGQPKFDPHGDPIPDRNGLMKSGKGNVLLSKVKNNSKVIVTGVNDESTDFLHYLTELNININSCVEIIKRHSYNKSVEIKLTHQELTLSIDFNTQQKILVRKLK